MANRFTDQAANADVLKDDGQIHMPHEIGADGTPRDRSDRTPDTRGGEAKADQSKAEPKEGEAKPGNDINAAGFVKDKDAAKP
ncbi:MAG TPA: hypothetical protein VGA59_02325 [Ramlibacter sp.]|jgi:hypothetical protein